jgi:ribosomal protein S18 acetylase RimI-like enzyme
MQLMAQLADYKSRYKGASYQLVLYRKKPVGRLYCWESAEEVRVIDISILPEFRGKGLGGALLADVIKAAKRQKKPVTLHVYPDNPAKRLYERLGFRKVGDNQASEFLRLDH